MASPIQNKIDFLIERAKKQNPAINEKKIRAAYECANAAHEGQKRKNGEPYIIHPVSVAEIIVEMGLDTDSICAGLLHDCIEDTEFDYKAIENKFGTSVAELVDGVTRLGMLRYSKEQEQFEDLRKMFLAMAKDIRVILIKLADRLHNARTFQFLPERKQRDKALETMEIYAPIAHRLGMSRIKWELEDLSLKCLDPIGYQEIVEGLEKQSSRHEEFLGHIKEGISEKLNEARIQHTISARVKHIYSIYRKMYAQHKTINEIYDICAVRVIVDSVTDCYNVLGYVHDLYKPIPGRFKDYISTPKPNGYQSLHTTVIGREGIPFEIQIRTEEMHKMAEYGVAAHWKYKQGMDKVAGEQAFAWIRQLLEAQQDTEAEDFIKAIKVDLFADEVFVFTPKGDVIGLPAGATLIDFAYAIHSAVGNRMTGGKINGRIVTIDTQPQSGDVIEVLTSKASRGPSRDWLKIAKTSGARSKIKQWFKRERREENIEQGKESLERELKRYGLTIDDVAEDDRLPAALKKLSFNSLDDLCAGIGYGGVTALRAANRIREEWARTHKQPDTSDTIPTTVRAPRRSESGVIVEGVDSCLVKFAHCCTPVPGDAITGFVTRGYGVSVHAENCANVRSLREDAATANRFVPVSWADETEGDFVACVELHVHDRVALIADVTTVLANLRIMIHSMQTKQLANGTRLIALELGVSNSEHLQAVCLKLKRVKSVLKIVRSGHVDGEIV
ncbi:MAG: bifunctional (p)ppGpp synthetase/guanosine-3',5'-bis(diphosphate) 3'-pyrophosphohydrolase [Butyricicoccus sp.]|nr:bifunctional (p)ppGpp synthetase/guanosine-3',5'-bis(diphosphate) 3'-pyrophosphohydrolase [Butyricicoccus sp.]